MKELPIPPQSKSNSTARELVRIWEAEGNLETTLDISAEDSQPGVFWGLVISDLIKHAVKACHQTFDIEQEEAQRQIMGIITGNFQSDSKTSDQNSSATTLSERKKLKDLMLHLVKEESEDNRKNFYKELAQGELLLAIVLPENAKDAKGIAYLADDSPKFALVNGPSSKPGALVFPDQSEFSNQDNQLGAMPVPFEQLRKIVSGGSSRGLVIASRGATGPAVWIPNEDFDEILEYSKL